MYIDTDIVYALIKPEDRHAELAMRLMQKKEAKYSSTMLVVELELLMKREIGNEASKSALEILMETDLNIELKEIDKQVLASSIGLRKKYDLGIFDSIHAATSLLNDKRIASTDESFDRVEGLHRVRE